MGKLKFIILCCLIFATTSCERLFNTDNVGQPVKFGTTLSGSTPKTRTSYSGVVDGNTERIYWSDGDQVSIYMDWNDGNGYTGNPEHGIYSVNPGSKFHNDGEDPRYGRISYANDGEELKWHGAFNGGDGRAHEYPHTFYSAYPSNRIENFDGTDITFKIPEEQSGVNMSYAYMTAYEPDVNSNTDGEGHVELHYYPRVTTLYIEVENDTDETVGGSIKLISSNRTISGNYTVDITDSGSGEIGNNNNGNKEITNTIKTLLKGDSDTIAFFIRPRKYNSGELSLSFNGKTQALNKDFEPNRKYNIKITVSGKVPPMIDDALAQMILAYMRSFGDGDNFYKKFKRFIDQYYPENNGHLNFWNSFTNNVDVSKVDGAADRLSSFFGDKLNDFIAALGEVEEISLNSGGYEIKSDSLKIDNTIFKNLKKIDLQLNKDIKIYVKGLDSLTTFSVVNGSNGTLSLYCEDCSSLKTISVMPDGAKVNKLSLIRTPKFESATIKNMNQSEMDIYLEDCSTSEEVTNAYIQIENKNTKKNVTRVGNNTSKVHIE